MYVYVYEYNFFNGSNFIKWLIIYYYWGEKKKVM